MEDFVSPDPVAERESLDDWNSTHFDPETGEPIEPSEIDDDSDDF